MAVDTMKHKEMIRRVEALDPDAAEYLRTAEGIIESDMLDACMIWSNTPQGHAYWRGIRERLTGSMYRLSRNGWHGYADLIERVRAIDSDAADYLNLYAYKKVYFVPGFDLSRCFVFDETPQGHKYWWGIYEMLPRG